MPAKKKKEKDKAPAPSSSTKTLPVQVPIKTWLESAQSSSEQHKETLPKNATYPIPSPGTPDFQKWIMSMKDQPELLAALLSFEAPASPQKQLAIEAPTSTGKSSSPISKTEKGESSSSKPLSHGKMTLAQYEAQNKKKTQDIFDPVKQKTQLTVQPKTQGSKYFPSTNFQIIAAVEPEFFDLNPWTVAEKYFGK